jgi:hypothetical protein
MFESRGAVGAIADRRIRENERSARNDERARMAKKLRSGAREWQNDQAERSDDDDDRRLATWHGGRFKTGQTFETVASLVLVRYSHYRD